MSNSASWVPDTRPAPSGRSTAPGEVAEGRADVEVILSAEPPAGWTREPGRGLRLRRTSRGSTQTIRVRADRATDLASALDGVLDDIRARGVDVLVASADVWPHPEFGQGRHIQSAHVDGIDTLAHDVYLFVCDGLAVRVQVDCRLVDLLAIEDEVATVVGLVRLAPGGVA